MSGPLPVPPTAPAPPPPPEPALPGDTGEIFPPLFPQPFAGLAELVDPPGSPLPVPAPAELCASPPPDPPGLPESELGCAAPPPPPAAVILPNTEFVPLFEAPPFGPVAPPLPTVTV